MKKSVSGKVSAENNGIRLETFLKRSLHLTKNEISRAKFRTNGICVNGARKKINAVLQTGDLIEVLLETGNETSDSLKGSTENIVLLYEDEDVIVVDKPAGISVHPAGNKDQDTLADRLAFYLRSRGEDSVIRIFGRLDKDTSGTVLTVKNRAAAIRLERQRKNGQLFKTYLAVTESIPNPLRGTIEAPLGPDPARKKQMCVDPNGKPAVTHYETLETKTSEIETLKIKTPNTKTPNTKTPDTKTSNTKTPDAKTSNIGNGRALVRLRLETGKTHQIRVHMASIGCPLLGDSLYGNGPLPDMGRTALHAQTIHFLQPFTGKEIQVEAPVPEDMRINIAHALTI